MSTSIETPAVALHQLQFRWSKQAPLTLDIPELRIMRGEKVFLMGPSGSGKSTLLNLLSGINAPSSGSLSVLGHAFDKLPGRARDQVRADHLGVIFQQFNLLPYLNVIDNVTLPCKLSAERRSRVASDDVDQHAHELLSALHIAEHLHAVPITALSVGQQQRVAAARAFMGSPALIIADEPTSALDTDRQEAFIQLLMLQCQKNNATLVFVSHHRALADHFDRVIPLLELQRSHAASAAATGDD